MNKSHLKKLIFLSLLAVICLAIGIALTIIGAITISNGVKKTNENTNKLTTISIGGKSTTTTTGSGKINSTTTTSSFTQTTSTLSPIPYYPPKSGIVFGILSGDKIKVEEYMYIVQKMIPNVIASNWTHPERVGALSYNVYVQNQTVPFNQADYNTIRTKISSFFWHPGKRNISIELNYIRQMFFHSLPKENNYMQTILFTGSSDKDDIENSITDAMMLNLSGQFTIVGVGRDVDKTLLEKLTKNVMIWYYGGNEKQITNQLEEMIVNFNPIPFTTTTTAPPITSTMIHESSKTTTSPLVTKTPTVQTTTQNPPIIYNPCFTDIILAVDTSSDILSLTQFQEQISLLTDNITSSWTHYERVALTSYDDNFVSLYTFNTIKNHDDFKSKINTFTQNEGSSLTRLLSGLLTLTIGSQGELSIFIFISKLNYGDLQFAKSYAQELLKKGKLNFIILDKEVNPYDLVSLNASKITSYNFTKENLPQVMSFFETSYSCNFVPSTPWPSTTTILPTTTFTVPTTTKSNIYYPPKSAVVFAIDSNKNIDNNLYQNVKSLLTGDKLITSQWTYPSRVGVFGYDSNEDVEVSPFGLPTFTDIKNIVNGFKPLTGNCSISVALRETKLIYYTSLQSNIQYMQTIVFTSCSDLNDINNAMVDAFFLREMGQLVIVGVGGNVSKENLLKLTDKVALWNGNMYDENFINFIEGLIVNFKPTVIGTTTTTTVPPSTTSSSGFISSKITTISHSTLPQTTTFTQAPITTTFTPPIPYFPCKTNIILAVDASSDVMTNSQFTNEINLIQNTVTANWTHFDRVAISWYNNFPSTFFSYNTIKDKKDLNAILKLVSQEPGYSLSKLLSNLTYLHNTNSFKTSTFIFISKVDVNDIEYSIPFANDLLKKGHLNFIIIGNTITPEQLSKLLSLKPSSIIQWNYNNTFDILTFFDQNFDC